MDLNGAIMKRIFYLLGSHYRNNKNATNGIQ